MKRMLALLALLLVLVPACAMAYTVKYYEWGADTPYFVQDTTNGPVYVLRYGETYELSGDGVSGGIGAPADQEMKTPQG